ncbi:hypothetical protein PISMIDRAFT_12927 [Pisolithus microcarpus 441]|uniref:Uncharacterized protein n=1 Tax=Pisolithus microcarpus 441 TaxID=765257 RepID=A0A0C9ZDM7_9AGAM|nr:hypothetical protein BKA83DRAFT_12927 [Pisolithus microcarpus]KIK20562.1 hypothetical protein PISMIDRAFT_12927 [Pisolithus microcarpus 441]
MLLGTKANPQLADLLASEKPVIIGAPPLQDSKSSKGKRIFYNGKTDYDGPVCLPNPAMTRIKRQVGGGGKATDRTAEEDECSSLSPSPAPRTLHSMLHKGVVREMNSLVKGVPKSMYGCKRVEVVIPTMARKVGKRPPSVITIGDSSGPDATNVRDEDKGDTGDYGELFLSDDEWAASTHKHKAKSQQSLHPTKRVASLLNMNTAQLSNPNIVKVSSQTRSAMKKRIQVVSPLISDSPSEERLPRTITSRNPSRPDKANVMDRHKACGNATDLFVSDDEQVPSTHKCKEKPQRSSRPMKQPVLSLEVDTTRLSGPKVVKTSSWMRPEIKKPRLRFISPLSSKLSSEEELESRPPGDHLNVTSPRVLVDHQQSSGELHIEQLGLQAALSLPQEDHLPGMPSHEPCHNGLPNLPLCEVPGDEVMQTEQTVSRLQEDKQLSSGSHPEAPRLEAAQSQVPPPHILGGQPIAGHPSHEPAGNQVPGAPHQEPHRGLLLQCQEVPLTSIPYHDHREEELMECVAAPWEAGYESQREQPGVTVLLPAAGPVESGRHGKILNPSPYLPTQQSHLQSGQPGPQPVQGVGQNHDPDKAFNLSQRIYPDRSMAESSTSLSTASTRLLAAEEGYIGGSSGDREMVPAAPVSECPGEPNHDQAHPPLPHCHYHTQMSRDHELQDRPMHVGPDRVYHGNDQFGYKGIAYHPNINPGWYNPSGRGLDARYGPYHHQYILPPPFTPHRYPGYANNPIMHWQPAARISGHYTDAPLPFQSMHDADYANTSGGQELSARPYRHAEVYNPKQSDAGILPGTQGSTDCSMGAVVTSLDIMPGPSDAAGNIPSTSDV